MTKFRIYRISERGVVTQETVEALDWTTVVAMALYSPYGAIFRIEVVGGGDGDE